MMKITVNSAQPDDYRVIHDLLRVYFPRMQFRETADGAFFYVNNNELHNDDREVLIKIENRAFPLEVKVSLVLEGHVYSQVESLEHENFQEENSHRERRLLRLAFHRVLVRALAIDPSPWGILTGVRPTKIAHRFLDEGFSEKRMIRHLTRDYDLSSERAELLTKVALFQHPFLSTGRDKLISLYIGIPFCPTRCHYCSFPSFSLEKWGQLLDDYLESLCREIAVVGDFLQGSGVKVQTVYLGGGTPTILSETQLAQLLEKVEEHFSLTADRELTVEGGRPDTLSREKLRVLREHLVTRLSINPQTMRDETLVTIGRQHTIQEVYHAYELAREIGIPVINMDLIIGLPGENCVILEQTLAEVLELAPENITFHALAMKRAAYYRQEQIALLVPDEGIAMMDLAHHRLQVAGYSPYYLYRQKESFAHGENVGYTVTGKACLYNIQMMEERQTILGFGVGSGSKLVHTADWTLENIYNPKDLLFYLARREEIIQKKVDKLRLILYNN